MYKIHSWVMLLSPPQASFCREAGKKKRKRAGHDGKVKREERPALAFSLIGFPDCNLRSFAVLCG